MMFLTLLVIVVGLCLFEIITSVDNAIINADVLSTMDKKNRRLFLIFGVIVSVFIVRGLLPWIIVWIANPHLGPWTALISSFSADPAIKESVESSAPMLLIAGGVYLIFLFMHWWFVEPKTYGLVGERFVHRQAIWFYSVVSLILAIIVWLAVKIHPWMAFSAVIGSTAFFITHGFKVNAEEKEKDLKKKHLSDMSKIAFLLVIDSTFSIDSVLGAFAFTLSVPLIFLGNGIGAIVVQQLTVRGVDKIKQYVYLKNGAMYSILFLGLIMTFDSFGVHIPEWLSPIVTITVVGYFFYKSHKAKIENILD
ncbi:MAG TPA: DUF475 domain-containing protein [Candidatus Nanoarchaeia archaeon]|nr:DUF475 domain-containing protein [Candidatus Nanoarchaeia archaeon]